MPSHNPHHGHPQDHHAHVHARERKYHVEQQHHHHANAHRGAVKAAVALATFGLLAHKPAPQHVIVIQQEAPTTTITVQQRAPGCHR